MILQVGKVIYSLLTNDKELNSLVNKKIYPLIADADTSFPFIVYRRNGVDLLTSKDRFINTEIATVEIIVASENYNESVEIALKVKNALHNKRGMIANINVVDINLYDANEDYVNNTFIQKLNFKIKL